MLAGRLRRQRIKLRSLAKYAATFAFGTRHGRGYLELIQSELRRNCGAGVE